MVPLFGIKTIAHPYKPIKACVVWHQAALGFSVEKTHASIEAMIRGEVSNDQNSNSKLLDINKCFSCLSFWVLQNRNTYFICNSCKSLSKISFPWLKTIGGSTNVWTYPYCKYQNMGRQHFRWAKFHCDVRKRYTKTRPEFLLAVLYKHSNSHDCGRLYTFVTSS